MRFGDRGPASICGPRYSNAEARWRQFFPCNVTIAARCAGRAFSTQGAFSVQGVGLSNTCPINHCTSLRAAKAVSFSATAAALRTPSFCKYSSFIRTASTSALTPICSTAASGASGERPHASGLQSLRPRRRVELHPIALVQLFVAPDLDRAVMHEHIRATIIGRDESEPLGGVEQLNFSGRHIIPCNKKPGTRPGYEWKRELGSNQRPLRYERSDLPLIYPAETNAARLTP